MKKKFVAIDLFSGAGGLTEGFMQTQRFDFVAHVEWEKPMVETLRNNLVKRWKYSQEKAEKAVIHFDIQKTDELMRGNWSSEMRNKYEKTNHPYVVDAGIDGLLKGGNVDVIIGGPPCQAYSIAGRAQDSNSMRNDYRNFLFESFVKVVDHYKPKVFVFENVPGILSAKPGDKFVIERIWEEFDKIGYEIRKPSEMSKSIYSASDFDVPQERHRVIIFGVKKEGRYSLESFYDSLNCKKSKNRKRTVRDAIGDLPKFTPLKTATRNGEVNVSHELVGEFSVPQHEARYHNSRDISIFKTWLENDMNKLPNNEKIQFYKKMCGKSSKHNKYRSLEWDKPAPTIVAHLNKDGLMFIHPDKEQLRSITIREAALLQTFPMDFEFVGSNSSCFKMIGNAVPVQFAKSIASSIIDVLEEK